MNSELIASIVLAVFASSGFWAFLIAIIQKRMEKKDAKTQMILGLGHDLIVRKSEQYLNRGWVTTEEYEDLNDYLFKPYKNLGGNGTAEKLMSEVRKLPIRNPKRIQNGSPVRG